LIPLPFCLYVLAALFRESFWFGVPRDSIFRPAKPGLVAPFGLSQERRSGWSPTINSGDPVVLGLVTSMVTVTIKALEHDVL
jgi:hypothetical protein